ncbi:hypothetical protein QZH41_013321 [Actinostola sp. cb2023]|nr:hypothetical protein QZH41_013321 [Actinostola sp. cb2023]
MKVIWANYIIYRIYQNKHDILKVEISPGDGTIFTSSGLTGKFFNHFRDAETEEKMYTSTKPPPDRPGVKYSTAKLLRQGSRLFDFILHVGLHASSQPSVCWRSECLNSQESVQTQSNPVQISETANVPNVGRFVAYSNGHLHIAFSDRTLLNVRHDPMVCREDLWFNFTLPNGQVLQGNSPNMQGLERYMKMACEWGDWVNCSPQQRNTFYKDTICDHDQQRYSQSGLNFISIQY